MLEKVEKFITSLETAPMSIAGWLAGFVGVVWVRIFLEAFSNPDVNRGYMDSALPTLLHNVFFYLGTVVVVVVVVSIITRISPLLMMRASVFMLPLIWLAPLIDLAYGGARIAYVSVATPTAFLTYFLTFFGPLTSEGATLGLRIEIGIILLILGSYVYVHTKRLSTTFIGTLFGYGVVFVIGVLPSLLFTTSVREVLQNSLIFHDALYPSETYSVFSMLNLLFDVAMAQIWYLIFCASGITWLYCVRKNVVVAMFRNIRPERVMHYIVMAFIGGLIALSGGSQIGWTVLDTITIVVALITIVFACMFAIVVNDVVDEPIDAISNMDRPLITGALTKDMMREAAFVCGLMTLAGALVLGSYATFWVMLFSAAYYIYSALPLRLKRVPILASALIGIASLAIMLLGFFLVSTNQVLGAFPAPIALLVVLFMTLVANMRDLKDIEGDTAAGIWTLPTLLGDRRARMVIGAMTFIASTLVPIFIPIPVLWIPSLIAGAVSWVGLISGKGERFVFSLYFVYLISIVFLLRFF